MPGFSLLDGDTPAYRPSGGPSPPVWTYGTVWDHIPQFVGNAGEFTFGVLFSADIDIEVVSMDWYQEASGPASALARLWNPVGPTLLDTAPLGGGFAAGWNPIPFTVPIPVAAGVSRVGTITIPGDNHGYTNPTVLPQTSADTHVTIPASGGLFGSGSGYPGSSWDGMHGLRLGYRFQ